ncbi:hypothetical protein CUMW_074500 [Citrus unshiu]|nr:hypothetical protein CUMW_074500 [Citrus unshiu]
MMSIISIAADLMQDFKTDYLTRSSAKSVFVSEVLGAAMGCVIGPLTLWLYSNAFDIRSPDGPCKAPYAVIYREIAIPGIQDVNPKKISQFIPIPTGMAIPFYSGAFFAVDIFVGAGSEKYAGAVVSGLICGDGIWSIASATLSVFRLNAPICMSPFS